MVNLDVEVIHARQEAFHPIGSEGIVRFNYHGVINERGSDKNHGYTQVFRNGCLEATQANLVRPGKDKPFIAAHQLEQRIFRRLPLFINGLQDAGVPPPLIIMFTLEGVRGARYAVYGDSLSYDETLLPRQVLRLPECVLEDFGTETDYHRVVQPAFDALWNAIGYAKSEFFDADGRWRGEQS